MSPDEAWSVDNPGWDWLSVLFNNTPTNISPFNTFSFVSFEHAGPRSFEQSHEIKIINGSEVRALSGYFEAEYHYVEPSGDEQTTHVLMQFSGALPASKHMAGSQAVFEYVPGRPHNNIFRTPGRHDLPASCGRYR